MSSILSTARRAIQSRPLVFLTASTTATLSSYAYYIEYQTSLQTCEYLNDRNKSNDDDNNNNHDTNSENKNGIVDKYTLPMDYNRDALLTYWNYRPISVIQRISTIVKEVVPFALSYTKDFYILPSFSNHKQQQQHQQQQQQQQQNKEKEDAKRTKLQTEYATELRHILTRLGPAFVKLGQQLSIRPDLLPSNVLFELQLLCDQVKPISDDVAKRILMDEFDGRIRIVGDEGCCEDSEINEDGGFMPGMMKKEDIIWVKDFKLVASASLGQVYKATHINPNTDEEREIAIKIQRPEMKDKVSLDLYLLNNYGTFLDYIFDKVTNQVPFHESFINCFANGSYNELDYIKEASNQMYLKHELAKRGMTEDVVYIPSVHYEMTSQKVITMDWVDGMKLANSPTEDVQKLIPVGVELFLTQLLDIGFFHADPHPGNLYVIQKKIGKNESTPILCLLDFGLCAEIDQQSRLAMTAAIVHLLNGDYNTLINKDAKDLGFLPHDLDISNTDIQPILTKILKEGLLESKSSLVERKRNLMSISNELNEVFFQYPFSVPPFFALITRGLGLLEGIALSGDPNFDIFQASYPYASKRAAEIYGKHSLSWLKKSWKDMKILN